MNDTIPPVLLHDIRTWAEMVVETGDPPRDDWEVGYQAAYREVLARFFHKEVA